MFGKRVVPFTLTILFLASLACTLSPTPVTAPPAASPTPLPPSALTPAIPPAGPAAVPTGQPQSLDRPEVSLAHYSPVQVDVQPSAPSYTFGLESLVNLDRLAWLSQEQQARLETDGFVVVPGVPAQIYELYQLADGTDMPAFVTTDALLHAYHVLYDFSLRHAELTYFVDAVGQLSQAMVVAAETQYQAASGDVREAARRNVAFFSVAAMLLDPDFETPELVAEAAAEELTFIRGHSGIFISPLFGYREDYSQYTPRGHYTRNETFERYFQAMMWLGRLGFRVRTPDDPAAARLETRQAMLMVLALHDASIEGVPALRTWERVYLPTVFFVEAADDLTVYDYTAAARAVYGQLPTPSDLADEAQLSDLMATLETFRSPRILGGPLTDQELAELGGLPLQFRFMGQRFVPDSAIFQQLVYSDVGLYQGNGKPPFTLVESAVGPIRGFPRGLDVAAVLGSERALTILEEEGDTDYDGYGEQLARLQAEFAELPTEQWNATLYWNWLYSLQPLLELKGDGYPPFMQSAAWADKDLNTWLGSWAELRHDTILYAKQSYTAEATSVEPEPRPVRGYVEPQPAVYARLAALTRQMLDGLDGLGLLDDELRGKLMGMEDLLLALKTMAEKELRGQALDEVEYLSIREIGDRLEQLTTFSSTVEDEVASETDDRMAIVADVHTDPNSSQVLEEGVGDAFAIYVIVQVDGARALALGGVFSYYEFRQPLADRLTDEAWQGMDPRPALPNWTDSFIVP
jgi:hypothetical protein